MKSPILLVTHMIDRKVLFQLVEGKLADDQFIVSVSVSPTNQISVLLDSEKGVTIEHCVQISRQIEENLDRENDDYELQVSSAGLGQAFKVYRQYVKNLDKEIEVVLTDGIKLEGILKHVDENGFDLETSKLEKVEGNKKKQRVTQLHKIAFDKAKTVKNIIKF